MDNILPSKLDGNSKDEKDLRTGSKLFDDSCGSLSGLQLRDRVQDFSKPVGLREMNMLAFADPINTDKPDADAKRPVPQAVPDQDAQRSGIIPPYMLEELSKRNPASHAFSDTLIQMRSRPAFWPFPSKPKNFHGSREVYDAEGKMTHPGIKARFEGAAPTGKAEVDNAYDFTGEVRSFYKDLYNRNSIDNHGMKFISTVNYGADYNNAFWNGSQMTYGKPGPDSPFKTFMLLDVCGHEITHGVTEKEAKLKYYGQAGALNESLSDVFGELIKQHYNHQTAKQGHWLVGEGIWKDSVKGRGLRDMMNPGTAYDDAKVGKDPQPANMKDYVKTTRDNGGVHINSGIPNRAFALFATSVEGNAWEKPGHIWYAARKAAGSNPSFAQFAYHTIEQAKKLGFDSEVPKLQKAWKDVGVEPSATEKDISTPPKKIFGAKEEPVGWTPMYKNEDGSAKKDKSVA